GADLEVKELEIAAMTLGQTITILSIKSEADLDAAFASAKAQGAAGVIAAAGSFEFRWSEQLVSLAARYALPAIYAGREMVLAGSLISYSGSQSEAHRLAGIYCGRVLKGVPPSDLPVLLPDKLELVINLKTAKGLGLTVPPMLLARVDEVIE